tara:strand:+ start:62 stop:448 length:387 start_codon:yes stop_codon:yes gene_type:complete
VILKRRKDKTSRSFKVSEIIRKAVSKILIRNELPLDIPFKFPISVINVEMNNDLKIAYIFVTTHEDIENKDIINRLNLCKYYLAKEMNNLISLKFLPKLIFKVDESLEDLTNIEKVLSSEKVLKDIKK